MAKKKVQLLPDNPTPEELEAEQERLRQRRRREEEDPEATPPPVDETPIPDNTGSEIPEMPTDNNDTVIVTGDPENPEIIIIPGPEPEGTLNAPESVTELTEIKENADGEVPRSTA